MKENKVVMAGAGVMGASLAQVYALAGYDTYVYDIVEAGLEKGKHLKILYATQVKVKPPTFVIFCNEPEIMHFSMGGWFIATASVTT